MTGGARILVGYDGSEQAQAAVRWAARQARSEQRGLHLVHCWIWPLFTHDLGPVEGVADSGLKHSAEMILAEGESNAREEVPDLDIKTSLIVGLAPSVLAGLSHGAHLLVVGSRGLGGFMGLLVGSVSLELAVTAACPLVVVRDGAGVSGPVVVGVDGSAAGDAALHEASRLASLWKEQLKVVHVLKKPSTLLGGDAAREAAENTGKEIVKKAADRARRQAADLEVSEEVRLDRSVAGGLLAAAEGARLIVVGGSGQGGAAGALGSTANQVLHHAPGTVMVTRLGERGGRS